MHLNGKLLQTANIFKDFELRFISEITFLFKNVTFQVGDFIVEEGEEDGQEMFFITKGTVLILHR